MRFRNIIRIIILVPFLLSFAINAFAQYIDHVDANQEGKAIAITYELGEMADITLFVTQDGSSIKTQIPKAYLVGDVGKKVKPGKDKKILWRVTEQYPDQDFQGEDLSFIVKGKPSMRFFAMLNGGYSFDSRVNAGFTIGQIGQFGWYLKGMTTFTMPQNSEFECDENGYADGIMPAYSGLASTFKAYGVGGITVRLGIPVYLNVGVGYGTRVYDWETNDGRWVKNVPGSYSGMAIDAGVMLRMGSALLSVGSTMINGNFDVCLGLGIVF